MTKTNQKIKEKMFSLIDDYQKGLIKDVDQYHLELLGFIESWYYGLAITKRVCYVCKRDRHPWLVEYFGICLICKIKILFGQLKYENDKTYKRSEFYPHS